MKKLAQFIGVATAFCIGLLFIPVILLLLAACAGLATILLLVLWTTGTPIQVKKNGEVIGEVVYFEYRERERAG